MDPPEAVLGAPPASILREIWDAWITEGLIDEFSRIEVIKGQQGKGHRGFVPPVDRRRAIKGALAECPVGRWVEIGEFSRYMRAAGFQFGVTHDAWSLYICDPSMAVSVTKDTAAGTFSKSAICFAFCSSTRRLWV